MTCSKLLAYGTLLFDVLATAFVLYLCWLAITTQYDGSLPYLTALMGFLQVMTGVVLKAYFGKALYENLSANNSWPDVPANTNMEDTSI